VVDADVKAALLEAGGALVAVAEAIDVHRLDDPATDAWTLRELVAHASRGLLTIETTVAAPVDPAAQLIESATAYFALAMSATQVHAGIEQRARDAAATVGDDPGGYVRAALARVAPLVAATPLDFEVQHAAGRLRFEDYLATRVVELTLHTADIQLAIEVPVEFPEAPSAITRDVLVLLVGRADALAVACALTGRARPRCDVLG
jgi:Mycothiol maleylpyruvate isomerase N-terminal domain